MHRKARKFLQYFTKRRYETALCLAKAWAVICIVVIFLVNVLVTHNDGMRQEDRIATESPEEYRKDDTISKTAWKLKIARVYCTIVQCSMITCSFIQARSNPGSIASVFINNVYQEQCPHSTDVPQLTFENCKFADNKLEKGWLDTELELKKLIFRSCSLRELEADAFSGDIYGRLDSLSLIDNSIEILKKPVFDKLVSLERLAIRNNIVNFADVDLLHSAAESLKVLEFDHVIRNTEVLNNITGKSHLHRIQILSIKGNSIPTISENTFKGISSVKSLYIENSAVSTVHVNAFEPFAKSINQIFINDNRIASLSEGLLDSILHFNPKFQFNLKNNPWNCNCELEWMQKLIKEYPQLVTYVPTCVTPKRNALLSFTQASFCDKKLPSASESTTSVSNTEQSDETGLNKTSPSPWENTTAASNTEQSPSSKTETLICSEVIRSPQVNARKLLSTEVYEFQSRFPGFSVKELANGSVFVNLTASTTGVTLVWLDNETNVSTSGSTDNVKAANCIANVRGPLSLDNLHFGTSYTFCLLQKSERSPSPFNCLALTKRPTYEAQLWLANKDKTIVLCGSAILIIALCIVSFMTSYCVVRKNPTLLRGSKRVIMLKPEGCRLGSRNHFAEMDNSVPVSRLSIANEHVIPLGQGPSLVRNGSESSGRDAAEATGLRRADQLDPREFALEKRVSIPGSKLTTANEYVNQSGQGRPLVRNGSESSGMSSLSSGTSYVSGIEPTSIQLMTWRLDRIRDNIITYEFEKQDIFTPPPLPPRQKNGCIPTLSLSVDSKLASGCESSNCTE